VGKIQASDKDLRADLTLYKQAVEFHSLLSESNSQLLARRFPNVYEAWYIYSQEEDTRWYIEGLVTAKSTPERIAEELELELLTVQFYEYLFFDVRSHKGTYYFLTHCLGGASRGVVDKSNLDTTLKMLALHGGGAVLRDYLAMGNSPEEVTEFYRAAIRSQQRKNMLMAESGRTINRFSERHVIEQYIEQQKLDLVAQQAGLTDSAGAEDSLGNQTLAGLGMTIATFSPGLVERTSEIEPRAAMNVIMALNGGNMKPVDAEVVPPPPSADSTPQKEPGREPDGPKD